MSVSVEKILGNNYVDTPFYTHVSMVQPRGRFHLNKEQQELLWDSYIKKLQENPNAILGIAEKIQPFIPVLVDIDLKIKDDGKVEYGEHLYTTTQLHQVISIYQSVLRTIVDGCTDANLMCVVLEKSIYYVDVGDTSYAKNGFHLHFPALFLSRVDQQVHLIPRVQKLMTENEVFKDLGIEDSGTVVDEACARNPWLMYGSRKQENLDSYTVTKVISSEGKELDLEEAFEDYLLYDRLKSRIVLKGRVRELLPRILSIHPYHRSTMEVKEGLPCPLREKFRKEEKNRPTAKHLKVSVQEALKISEKLLPMLADFRAENYNEWMRVGWILYNIGKGCTEALDQWLQFSARCGEKYDEGKCIYEWSKMIKKDLTLGTLRHLAKIDSPKKYGKFKSESVNYHAQESLNGSHWDIAKALHAQFGDEFVCASIPNKLWYQFRNHKWEQIEDGVFLRQKISKEIVDHFVAMGKEAWDKLAKADKAESAMYNERLKHIRKIMCNLKSAPFKNNIMREALEVFYDRRFKGKLNQNPYLIGFKNGVYDLKTCIFRDGAPEDFISKCVPIAYKEYDESSEEVQQVIEFLQKVFPDKSIRTYFLDTYSDIFVGGNSQKKVYLWTGEGDNGKSITQMLFELMLGELAIKFNTQYFTGKKVAAGSANPELARAAPPVRHATMEEPDAGEMFNTGELKKLSGNDTYWARDLFQKGKDTKEVKPMFVITCICNKLPQLRYSDKATWNRLRVIPFESTFVEPGQPCPKTFEEQLLEKRFPMDKTFGSKIPKMVGAFAWYLLQWRQKVTVRIEPDKVKEATAMYRRRNDIYRQFIEESICDADAYLSLSELYGWFRDWFKEGWPGTKIASKNDVREYFERLWGEPLRGVRWHGYRIRTLEEVEASGDTVVLGEKDLVDYEMK